MPFNPSLLGKDDEDQPFDPVSHNKQQLYSKLDAIASSDAPTGVKQAALDEGTKQGEDESWLMKALSVLDKGRAFNVAVTNQAGGALSNAGRDEGVLGSAVRALMGVPGAIVQTGVLDNLTGKEITGKVGDHSRDFEVGVDKFKQDLDTNKPQGSYSTDNTFMQWANKNVPQVPGIGMGVPEMASGLRGIMDGEIQSVEQLAFDDEKTRNTNPFNPLNKDLITATGFAADVALDPLNVIGGGGTLEKLGAKGVADLAFQAGEKGIGQKALKGLGTLSQGELDQVVRSAEKAGVLDAANPMHAEIMEKGLQGGLHLKGGKLLGGDVQLLGKDKARLLGPSQLRAGEELIRDSKLGKAASPLGGKWASRRTADGRTLTDLERRGTPDEAYDAFYTKRGDNVGEAKRAAYWAELGALRQNLVDRINKAGVPLDDVSHALAGSDEAVARIEAVEPGLFDEVRTFDDEVRRVANDMAGEEFIAHRDWHAPGLLTDEAKDAFGNTSKGGDPYMPSGFEGKANIVHGNTFLGEDLLPSNPVQAQDLADRAAQVKQQAAAATDPAEAAKLSAEANRLEQLSKQVSDLSPRQQAEEIAQRVLGDDYVQIFNPDWSEASAAQLRATGNRVKGKVTEKYLLDKGVAEDLWANLGPNPAKVGPYGQYTSQRAVLQQALGDEQLNLQNAELDAAAAHADQVNQAPGLLADQLRAQQDRAAALAAIPGEQAAIGQAQVAQSRADDLMDFVNAQEALDQQVAAQGVADSLKAAQAPLVETAGVAAEQEALGLRRLDDLFDLQDDLDARVARADEAVQTRIAEAANRLEAERQIGELEADIALLEADDTITVGGQRVSAAAVDQRLEETFKPQLQKLAEEIAELEGGRWAAKHTDAAVTLAAKRQEFEKLAKQYKSLKSQVTSHGPALEAKRAELASLEEQLRAGGKDLEADYLAQLRDRLPAADSGKLVAPDGPPAERDIWYHGTGEATREVLPTGETIIKGTLNLADETPRPTTGRTFDGLFDTLLGPHFVNDAQQADSYARTAGSKMTKPRVAQAEIHATNPKVYELGNTDRYEVAHSQLYFDGIEDAIARGHLDAETLAQASGLDVEAWDEVLMGLDQGVPLSQALDEVFAYRPDDPLLRSVNLAEDGSDAHHVWYVDDNGVVRDHDRFDAVVEGVSADELPPKVGVDRAVAREVMDGLTATNPELLQTIADDFKASLLEAGHDSILYQHGDRWAAIPLQPEQVRVFKTKNAPTSGTSRKIETPRPVGYADDGTVLTENVPQRVYERQHVAYDMFDHSKRIEREMRTAAKRRTIDSDPTFSAIKHEIERTSGTVEEAHQLQKRNQLALEAIRAEHEDLFNEAMDIAADNARQGRRSALSKKHQAIVDEVRARQRVTELRQAAQDAQDAGDYAVAQSLRLQANADQAALAVDRVGKKVLSVEKSLSALKDPGFPEDVWKNLLRDGFKQLGVQTQAPEYVVDALKAFTKINDPASKNLFLKAYDAATRVFKTYAIFTPGFHMRNFFGGVFNNWLADVDTAAYGQFLSLDRAYTNALKKGLSHEDALASMQARFGGPLLDAYDRIQGTGMLGLPGQIGSVQEDVFNLPALEAGKALGGPKRSLVTDNPATRFNYKVSEGVERHLRGTLALDRALKGFDEAAILDDVYKFHFDYGDLSDVERNVMKRVAPFYTWTRKNVPLQLEMFLKQPKKYVKYYQLKNEVELASPEEDVVPGWFGQQGAMRLPLDWDGKQVYLMPDLPMKSLQQVTDWRQMAGQLNPALKIPVEQATGTQLWNGVPFREGYVPVPETYNKMGLGKALQSTGRAVKGKDGQLYARDGDLVALESMLPLLGRARRAFPSEKKYDQRFATSMVNMFFGAGVRTNTDLDQAGELYGRIKAADETAKDLNTTGYGGYRQRTADIASPVKLAPGETLNPKKPKNPYEVLLVKRALGANQR